jgi:hypothetical protein
MLNAHSQDGQKGITQVQGHEEKDEDISERNNPCPGTEGKMKTQSPTTRTGGVKKSPCLK